MTGMLFQHPEWLTAIGATGLLIGTALLLVFARSRQRAELLLGSPKAVGAREALSDLSLFLALGLIGLALLGPRIGQREVLLSSVGVDLVILIDVSRSMDAEDVPPSRLERARTSVAELLELLAPGDRAALAGFAGRGVLFTPLTLDRNALAHMLPALDSQLIRPGGSDLRTGLQAAVEAFEEASGRSRVVLVLSDGEVDTSARDVGQAHAARANARVFAVALGSETGATVPSHGRPLRDASSRIVISRRYRAGLERLCHTTGGQLFLADDWGEVDLAAVANEIDRDLAHAEGGLVRQRQTVAVTLPFAATAGLLLWLEALPGRRRRAARRGGVRRLTGGTRPRVLRAGVAWPLLLLLLGAGSTAQEAAHSHFEAGFARATAGRGEAAQQDFLAAAVLAGDSALAALAYYNLGVLALDRGDLEQARDFFFDSLALRPADPQARFNLEWTLLALARPPPAPAPAERDTQHEAEAEHRPAEDEAPEEQKAAEQQRPGDARAAASASTRDGSPPPLTDAERASWLERVQDDPSRAMRHIAEHTRGAAGDRPRPSGPTW